MWTCGIAGTDPSNFEGWGGVFLYIKFARYYNGIRRLGGVGFITLTPCLPKYDLHSGPMFESFTKFVSSLKMLALIVFFFPFADSSLELCPSPGQPSCCSPAMEEALSRWSDDLFARYRKLIVFLHISFFKKISVHFQGPLHLDGELSVKAIPAKGKQSRR